MSKAIVETISALLPQLTNEELSLVRQQLKALGASLPIEYGPQAVEAEPDAFEDMVVGAVLQVCSDLGKPCPGRAWLRKGRHFGDFRQKLPALKHYVERATHDRTAQTALVLRGLELLHNSLLGWNIPIGGRILMTNVHRVPEVMDHSFPGYAASGMLGLIIKRRNHVRT